MHPIPARTDAPLVPSASRRVSRARVEVIGAGFGRTGTTSIKAALEHLGYRPCYHMSELGKNPEHRPIWQAASAGQPVDWEGLFEGYRATVDWPACTYYRELMRCFPDAKVVLSIRDPEQWYDSVLTTIYASYKLHRYARYGSPPAAGPLEDDSLIWAGDFDGRFDDRRYAISVFEKHNEEVIEHVPANKLLVFQVDQGWTPLCGFLAVAEPAVPFPHLNPYAAWWRVSAAPKRR